MKPRPILLVSAVLALAASFAIGVATAATLGLHVGHKHTSFRAVDSNRVEWVSGGAEGVTFLMRYLMKEDESGQVAMLVRYPAGQVSSWHSHSHGHAMYVLQGRLVTHRGTFPAGSYVWFPADEPVAHGAPPDEETVVLFLRHVDMATEHGVHPDH